VHADIAATIDAECVDLKLRGNSGAILHRLTVKSTYRSVGISLESPREQHWKPVVLQVEAAPAATSQHSFQPDSIGTGFQQHCIGARLRIEGRCKKSRELARVFGERAHIV